MRLIDADALKEKIIDLLEIEWGYEGIRENVSRIIDSMPTTEERPHGEWVFDTNFKELGNPYGTYKCSACGGHSSDKHSFCPNCGADMRKRGEQNEI